MIENVDSSWQQEQEAEQEKHVAPLCERSGVQAAVCGCEACAGTEGKG